MHNALHDYHDPYELLNAASVLTPLLVTIWNVASEGATTRALCVLVGWSAHAPCAVAYHLFVATGQDADVMLRMDQTLQLFAAVTNFLAQTSDIHITLVFACMCIHCAGNVALWDLRTPLKTEDHTRAHTIAAAVVTSCLPMIFSGHIADFCTAVAAFLAGGALLSFNHPFFYTPFHLLLGVFAWSLVCRTPLFTTLT